MDRDQAILATRNGAITAVVSAFMTLVVVLLAISNDLDGDLSIWNDPFNFIDVVLLLALAFGVYKKSRTAAIILFLYFLIAKVYIGIETGEFGGLFIALAFLYFFGQAIQGAFVFHKIEKAENPEYKTSPKWFYYLGIPVAIVTVALMGLGFLTMSGVLPSTEVQVSSEISEQNRNTLITNDVLGNDDHIEYFYSFGLTSIMEGGTILTDDRVILYYPGDNEELEIYALYFDEIESVELIEEGGVLSDSVYKISARDPEAWLQIALSAEKARDVEFINALKSRIEFHKNPGSI